MALTYKVPNPAHLGERGRAKLWAHRAKAFGPEDPSSDDNIGGASALLGETGTALDMLEASCARVDPVISSIWVKQDTGLDLLRDRPRLQRLAPNLDHRAAAKMASGG